jgi:hypothetical protein
VAQDSVSSAALRPTGAGEANPLYPLAPNATRAHCAQVDVAVNRRARALPNPVPNPCRAGTARYPLPRGHCGCALVAAEGEARAIDARVDSQNGCHHFQWWFRARIGTGRGLGRVDSALLEVVAPMKAVAIGWCRARAARSSRAKPE